MLRLINAVLALGVFGLFILHTILNVPTLVAYTYISWSHISGMLLFALLLIHAVINVFILIKEAVLRGKEKIYLKINTRSLILIISGVIVLVFMFIHYGSFGYTSSTGEYIVRQPDLVMFLINVIMTIAISLHCVFSLQNASITLGISSKSNVLPIKITAAVLSISFGVVGIVAYCIYYIPSLLFVGVA